MGRPVIRRWKSQRPMIVKRMLGNQAASQGRRMDASPRARVMDERKIMATERTTATKMPLPEPRRAKWMERGAARRTVTMQVSGSAQR